VQVRLAKLETLRVAIAHFEQIQDQEARRMAIVALAGTVRRLTTRRWRAETWFSTPQRSLNSLAFPQRTIHTEPSLVGGTALIGPCKKKEKEGVIKEGKRRGQKEGVKSLIFRIWASLSL
jgi:hypothetical protein